MAGGTLAEAAVRVRARSSVRRDVDDDVKKIDGGRAGRNVGGGFSKGFKGAISGLGAAFAAVGVKNFFMSTIEEAREAGKVTRLTNQVLKTTAGVANISAAGVSALADSLSRKNAVDDEVIQSGANLLLTFTRVRNEAGKGNDIFNQGVAIAADMSAALGKDMKGSAIAVGKALNDPIKGVTALSRVGVSFTQKQKDQIKTMVESGNVMGAQKLILAELKTEFGGAGAAAADPAMRAKVAWENFKESIGEKILPLIATLGEWFVTKLLPAVDSMIAAFKNGKITSDGLIGAFQRIGAVARQVWLGIKAFIGAFKEGDVTSDGFIGAMERFGVIVRGVFDYITGTVIPAFRSFLGWMNQGSTGAEVMKGVLAALVAGFVAFKVAMTIQMAITKAFIAVQAALNAVMALNPIGLVVVALIALAAGLVYAYKKSETFRNIVNAAWAGIKVAVSAVWNGFLKPVFTSFVIFLQTLGRWATWLWRNVIIPVWSGIRLHIAVAWAGIKVIFGLIKGGINLLVAGFRFWLGVGRAVWAGIKVAIAVAWSGIKVYWNGIKAGINLLVAGFRFWQGVARTVWNAVKSAISTAWNAIRSVFNSLKGWITQTVPNAFRSGVAGIKTAWDKLKGYAKAPVKFVIDTVYNNGIRKMWNLVNNLWGGKDLARVNFAGGGVLPGYRPGVDTIPAMLSPGEGILRPEVVRALGADQIMAWNKAAASGQRIAGFADGGIVGLAKKIGGGLFDLFTDPLGSIKKVLREPLKDLVNIPNADQGWAQGIRAIPGKVIDGLISAAKKLIPSFGGGDGGSRYLGRDPSGAVGAILAVAKRFYSGARVSSGYRNTNDYHGRGLAADLIGGGAGGMARIARGFYGISGRLIELIHTPTSTFVKNGVRVGRNYYASVLGQHYNHVHVAARRDALVGKFLHGGIVPQTGLASVHKGEEVLSVQDRREQITALRAVVERLEILIQVAEGIGPAVGHELTGGVTSARTLARGRVTRR